MRSEPRCDAEPIATQAMFTGHVGQRRARLKPHQRCINSAALKKTDDGAQRGPRIVRAGCERRIERLQR